jgi:hypothetical protein
MNVKVAFLDGGATPDPRQELILGNRLAIARG